MIQRLRAEIESVKKQVGLAFFLRDGRELSGMPFRASLKANRLVAVTMSGREPAGFVSS